MTTGFFVDGAGGVIVVLPDTGPGVENEALAVREQVEHRASYRIDSVATGRPADVRGEPHPAGRARWQRRALLLAYVTVAYNVLEVVASLAAGLVAGSVALLSFGGDSVVECLSALVIVWQYRSVVPEERERRAERLIGLAFLALAAVITVDAARTLITGDDADASPVGIAVAIASLVVMPLLARAKRRVGRRLGSTAVLADSTQTLLCTWLSVALLAGLLLDAKAGLWWADPLAALVIAGFATHEGLEAWRGDHDD